MKQVEFLGYTCNIHFSEYSNKRTAILLVDPFDPLDTVAVATTNIPDVPLLEDEVIIKDYSENEGMFDVLTKAGIVSDTGRRVQTGFVTCPICKLLQFKNYDK